MPFEVKYVSDFYRIEVDFPGNLLRATWLRAANTTEIVQGGTMLFQVLKETCVERAVADVQGLSTLTPESKEWMSVNFYQLLSSTNLKKLARILPANVFSRIALESVVTRADALGVTNFQVKNFHELQEAMTWLLS